VPGSSGRGLMFTEEDLHQFGGAFAISPHELEPFAKWMLRAGFAQAKIADGTDPGKKIVQIMRHPHCNRPKNFPRGSAPKPWLDGFPHVLRTLFCRLLAH